MIALTTPLIITMLFSWLVGMVFAWHNRAFWILMTLATALLFSIVSIWLIQLDLKQTFYLPWPK